MTSEQVIYLVILAACTVSSGFFSGSETALIGISKERVHRLATKSKAGRRIEQLLANPEDPTGIESSPQELAVVEEEIHAMEDGADEGDSDALAFQDLYRGTRIPCHELELTTCLFQRGYRHGDVVQRIGKHFRVVAWMGLLNGSRRRLNPAAWYAGPPFRTRSGIDG